jgi:hypothetical protein
MKAQLDLPLLTAQKRSLRRESEAFYASILALRRAGHRIYRGGRKATVVDGEIRSNQVIKALTRKE